MKTSRLWMAAGMAVGIAGLAYGAYAQTGGGSQPPRLIPYQGYLEDGNGPVNLANQEVTFFITNDSSVPFKDPCSGGAGCLWSETETINVANGYFSAVLGDGSSFPIGLFSNDARYLGVMIGDQELQGKQRLLSTPYAITAETAQNFQVQALTVAGNASIGGTLSGTGASFMGLVSAQRSTEATTDSTTGALRIADGTNTMWVDGDEILASSATMSVNPDGDNADTTAGTLVVEGALRVLGDTRLSGNATIAGSLHVGGSFLSYDDCGPALGNTVTCRSSTNSICSLASVNLYDNVTGSDAWHQCNVFVSGDNWVVVSNGSRAECYARCIYW